MAMKRRKTPPPRPSSASVVPSTKQETLSAAAKHRRELQLQLLAQEDTLIALRSRLDALTAAARASRGDRTSILEDKEDVQRAGASEEGIPLVLSLNFCFNTTLVRQSLLGV